MGVHAVPHRRAAALILCTTLSSAHPARAAWPSDPTRNLPVCTFAGDQELVQILADGHGGAWIAWGDGRVAFSQADIYVQKVLASGAVDPGWPADGLVMCSDLRQQLNGVMASDGSSGFVIAWTDPRTTSTNPNIYMHHVLAAGARDPAWQSTGLGVCTAAGEQFFRLMVPDGAGGILLAREDDRTAAGDIYAAHVSGSGVIDPAWPVNGLVVCTAAAAQNVARIVGDGSGGAVIARDDFRNSTTADVYARHLLANGSVDAAWPVNGQALCLAAGDQIIGGMLPDGSGGALLAWQHARARTTARETYATHVLGSGIAVPPPACERSSGEYRRG